jgi:hypothetical protein
MGIKLSEVLDRLKKIQNLNFEESISNLDSFIQTVSQNANDLPFINKHELLLIEKNLQESIEQYKNTVKNLEEKLKTTVFSNQKEYLESSKNIWKTNSEKMLFSEHLEWSKLWPPSSIELENFTDQIKRFINWQYAGLVVGSKNSDVIKSLTGTEPLFVVELFTNYFKLQKEKFHPDFIRKIRFYDLNDINQLPNNSFGIIVIYNEFTFLPWDLVSNILHHISNKLIPGGTLIFNYNNCETVKGFIQFENQSMTFSTTSMYIDFLSKYNINCVKKYDSNIETFSFLIFQKEGHKKLIKKYPSVGFIQQQLTFSNQALHDQKIDTVKKVIKAKSI